MQMAKTMSKYGHTIDIVTTKSEKKQPGIKSPRVEFISENSQSIIFKNRLGNTWSFSLHLWMWLKYNIKKYDAVHITGIFTFPVLIAAYIARRAGIPYIIRPAGTLDEYPLTQKSLKKKLYYKCLMERFIKSAEAIHVTSVKERDQVGLIGIKERCIIIPLGVETRNTEKIIRRNKHLNLLFLSRIHPIKAIPVLLEALALLKSSDNYFMLTIAGNGSREYLQKIKRIVKKLGLQNIVKFTGFAGGKIKLQLLEEADIFILPSYQENFGLAVVEALAAGLPVIISNQVAVSDDIKEAGAGLVVPIDQPEVLADAINSYTNYENRQLASKNAIDLVRNKFSLLVLQENLNSLYCSVCRNTGNGHG